MPSLPEEEDDSSIPTTEQCHPLHELRGIGEAEEEVKVFTTATYEGVEDSFERLSRDMASALIDAPIVDVGEWQSQKIDNPLMVTKELRNVAVEIVVPHSMTQLQDHVGPNLPWAEDHFQERVSGEPLNPPPSEAWWPYAQQGNAEHKQDEKFSHTYPERFWPKRAGWAYEHGITSTTGVQDLRGIRFAYGDLDDVVNQLGKSPLTRQAYLPVWFPEDTGAVHKERVPCTLGYHFLLRNNWLHVTYFIRSCDFVRHFRDDIYMAGRLSQWVANKLRVKHKVTAQPGLVTMHIVSFHIFSGDVPSLERRYCR